MKRITLLLSLLITSIGFSQNIPVDFQSDIITGAKSVSGITPADANWYIDSGLTSATVEDLASDTPDHQNAGKIVSSSTGQKWQNAQLLMTNNYMDLTTNKTITLDVYSSNAQDFLLKLEQSLGGGPNTEKSFSHTGTGWETFAVDFTTPATGQPVPNDQYKLLVIFPCYSAGFTAAAFDSTTYVDNISTTVGDVITSAAGPTTDAPTPTQNAADVISLFSDTYTDITSNRNPGWSEVVTAETHASNEVLKTTNFVPFAIATPIDITDHTLHVDVWLPQLPSAGAGLLIKILDEANGPHEGNYTYPIANITAGEWNSIDIDINDFNQTQGTWDATAQGRVDQVLVDIVDDTTMYVDNIYFWKAPTAGLDDPSLSAVEMYPNPAKGVVKFSRVSNEALEVSVYDLLGKQVMPFQTLQTELNISSLTTGIYVAKLQQGVHSVTKKLIVK